MGVDLDLDMVVPIRFSFDVVDCASDGDTFLHHNKACRTVDMLPE